MISQNLEKNLEILEVEEIDENIIKTFKKNNQQQDYNVINQTVSNLNKGMY